MSDWTVRLYVLQFCVCVCMCVFHHLISESTRFCYPDKLLMDGMRCERCDLQRFCCKMHTVEKILQKKKKNHAISLLNSQRALVPV